MKPSIFTTDESKKLELTVAQLQKIIDEAYEAGKQDAPKISVSPTWTDYSKISYPAYQQQLSIGDSTSAWPVTYCNTGTTISGTTASVAGISSGMANMSSILRNNNDVTSTYSSPATVVTSSDGR